MSPPWNELRYSARLLIKTFGLAATLLPVRRAARVDTIVALRAD